MSLAVRLIQGYARVIDFGYFDGKNPDELLPEFKQISLAIPSSVDIIYDRYNREKYPGFKKFIDNRHRITKRQREIDNRSDNENESVIAQSNDRESHNERDRRNADLRDSLRVISPHSQNAIYTLRWLKDPILSKLNQTMSDEEDEIDDADKSEDEIETMKRIKDEDI